MPTQRARRATRSARPRSSSAATRRRHHRRGPRPGARLHRRASARTTSSLNERVLPALLGKIRPEARRLLDLHRHGGRATYIVSAAPQEIVEPLAHVARHDRRHRHPRPGRRRRCTPASSTGPFCYGAGKVEAIARARQLGRARPQPVLRLQRLGQRPADAAGGRSPRRVNPDGRARTPRPRATAGRSCIFSQRTKTVIRRTVAGAASTAIGGCARSSPALEVGAGAGRGSAAWVSTAPG